MSNPPRACGPCTACCTVMGVHELAKGRYEACEHVCASGCGIYADRPTSCRTFECQWLRGLLEVDGSIDPELRPDACGVIFDFQPATPFGDVYTAWEVEPGASAGGPAADIIEGLAERFLVVIMTPQPDGEEVDVEHRFVGPPRLVAETATAEFQRTSLAARRPVRVPPGAEALRSALREPGVGPELELVGRKVPPGAAPEP